ncbi:MAG: 3-dehydroquinate synthase [Oscillospiraceae bacterium]|nr:3-dehydroquinate synthase [Oscillospiraceae bacterium]
MIITVELGENSYPIMIQRGALYRADTHFDLQRKVLLVTDSGVPEQYVKAVAARCADPVVVTVPQGEGSKHIRNFESLCRTMLEHDFTRTDCVVAVGGGMVGDLAGFAAASFMRGIDFYNVPTTVLAQVDSSVGGKVAIDLDGIKNCVGAFCQPKAVLIDPDVLQTLPKRHVSSGLAEALKMALTFDEELVSLLEQDDVLGNIDRIIAASVRIKAAVVQEDEKEHGLRRVLNFGHTIGHGIETAAGLDRLHHGECVALGMLPMCSDELRPRVQAILEKLGLPTTCSVDADAVWQAIAHDKKRSGDAITVVYAPRAGSYDLKKMSLQELKETVYGFLNGKV